MLYPRGSRPPSPLSCLPFAQLALSGVSLEPCRGCLLERYAILCPKLKAELLEEEGLRHLLSIVGREELS
jgi:hypothetical protein